MAKKVISNDRVYNNLEQYILTRNLSEINSLYSNLVNEGEFKYYTFRQINGPGAQLVNRLRGIGDLSVFYKIKTSALSLLQPKLKLYKITYEDFVYNADGTVNQGSVTPLPSPCYREFKFSDNFGIETAASVQDYLSYESTKPSFRNVGIESFMITQNGETHGAIENNIECKLTLTFKSLKDLSASPPGEPGLKYVDLILWPPAKFSKDSETYNPKHYEIKALVGYTAPSSEQLDSLNLSPDEVEALKNIEKLNQIVSLGLYDYDINIEENGSVKLTASYRGRLETVIGTNQVNIFQDSIRLGEAGQFEVAEAKSDLNMSHVYEVASKIKTIYRALNKPRCITKECTEKATLKEMTKNNRLLSSLVKEAIGDDNLHTHGLSSNSIALDITDEQAYFKWFKSLNNTKKILALLKRKVGFFKQQIYDGFIDQLVAGHPYRDSPLPDTRIFCAIASKDQVRTCLGIIEEDSSDADATQEEVNKKTKTMTTATENNKIDYKFGRCTDNLGSLKKQNEEAFNATSLTGVKKETDASTETETKTKKTPKPTAPSWMSDGDFKFYFIFLGDLIEMACKNAHLGALDFSDEAFDRNTTIYPPEQYINVKKQDAGQGYPLVNARLLLGPVEYLDSKGEIQRINLARMPISFAYFRSWFINKITKRRRTQMPLGSFLASLINDLVIPALGIDMPESFKPPHTRSHIISVTLPGEISNSEDTRRICNKSISATKESLPMSRVINTESPDFQLNYFEKAKSVRESERMVQTSYDYLLMYITSQKDIIDRTANPVEDVKDGIYHFNIGSDMGLLRKMDFKRVNLPSLAELRSEQAAEQGVDQLGQLKFPYDTDVYLVGTSLFIPGMFYYVNPSLAGLGSVENASSLAYQMNLGGYHLIGKVSTNIAAGKFITKITGTQTAQGRR